MARSKLAPKKVKVVRVTARQNDIINRKYMGEEPVYDGVILSRINLSICYNWHNFVEDYDTAREYFIDWVKENKPEITTAVEALDKQLFRPTMGWTARMLSKGASFEEDGIVDRFYAYVNTFKPIKKVRGSNNTADVIVKDRISEFLPDFEYAIDVWDTQEFDAYSYLTSNNVPQIYARRICDYYQPLLAELALARSKKDDQVNEAYSFMSTLNIRKYYEFVKNIIDDCERFLNNQKKTRKPRKKKADTPDKILKNFKYMLEHNQMKLTSVNPEKIIGAQTLFTLNTANNVLTLFHARPGGFTINRTAIMNYDEERSKCKRVGRKAQSIIDEILNTSKTKRERVLETVNTDFANFTNRLNEKTIILRVDK